MELYTSKTKFDSELLLKEIKAQYDTSSISPETPNVSMHNLDKMYQLPRLKVFSELVLPAFEPMEIDNIFLFFTHSSGQLNWHKDGGNEYRRFILPIVSNEQCINWFRIDEVEYNTKFEDGRVHWFDSQKIEHNIVNTGDSIRVAYLLDMNWEANTMETVLKNSFDRHNLFV